MIKKILAQATVLTLFVTTCISTGVFASGAELPKGFDTNKNIEDRATVYDVMRSYSSYRGKSVQVDEIRRQSNGDRYYYRGTVEYVGRDGLFGDYKYLGDLRKFTLYKIVTSNGDVITPTNQDN